MRTPKIETLLRFFCARVSSFRTYSLAICRSLLFRLLSCHRVASPNDREPLRLLVSLIVLFELLLCTTAPPFDAEACKRLAQMIEKTAFLKRAFFLLGLSEFVAGSDGLSTSLGTSGSGSAPTTASSLAAGTKMGFIALPAAAMTKYQSIEKTPQTKQRAHSPPLSATVLKALFCPVPPPWKRAAPSTKRTWTT